jgi:hypothetical protein
MERDQEMHDTAMKEGRGDSGATSESDDAW